MDVAIREHPAPWRKGQDTNSTAASFSALVDTETEPAPSQTRTVIDRRGGASPGTLRVKPVGGSQNDETVNVKVIGWSRVLPAPQETGASPQKVHWTPSVVCEVQGTLSSTLTGVSGGPVPATEFYCDALTLTAGIAVLHTGTADVDPAWFEVDVSMYELVEVVGDLGTADTQNWLLSL